MDTDPPTDPPTDDDPAAVFERIEPTAEVVKVGDTTVQFPADEDAKPQRQLLDFLKTGEGGNRNVTNGERMCIENDGEPYDIGSRCWKAWTISEVIGNQDNLNNLRSRSEYASNLNALAVEEQARFHQEIAQDLDEDLIMLPEFSDGVRTLHDQQ